MGHPDQARRAYFLTSVFRPLRGLGLRKSDACPRLAPWGLPSFARYAGYSYMDSTRGGTQTRRAPEQHGTEPGPPDLGTVPLKQKKA